MEKLNKDPIDYVSKAVDMEKAPPAELRIMSKGESLYLNSTEMSKRKQDWNKESEGEVDDEWGSDDDDVSDEEEERDEL